MKPIDFAFDAGTRIMLTENGRSDAARGVSKEQGWKEICDDIGFTPHIRTPAREAYEDGWYDPSARK